MRQSPEMNSFAYKGSRVVVREQQTGNLPEEDQRTCFCCSKKINNCKTVLLVNNYRNIPNMLLHAEYFEVWKDETEDLCRDIEQSYEYFKHLNDVFGSYTEGRDDLCGNIEQLYKYYKFLNDVLASPKRKTRSASPKRKIQRFRWRGCREECKVSS